MIDGKLEVGISLSPDKSRFGPLFFAGDLERGLSNASHLGFNGVELSLRQAERLDRSSLCSSLARLNLKVFAIATGQTYYTDGFSLFNSDPSLRQKAVRRMKGHIDLAAEIGSMVIIGGVRGTVQAVEVEQQAEIRNQGLRAIAECVEYAEGKGITLLLEPINRYETNVVNTLEEGLELIRNIGSPHLRLLPDTFHMNIEEASISQSITAAGDAVGYVHFADSNRLAPGWGHVDFVQVLSALRGTGYTGPIGIEILPKPDDHASAAQAIRFVRGLDKCL